MILDKSREAVPSDRTDLEVSETKPVEAWRLLIRPAGGPGRFWSCGHDEKSKDHGHNYSSKANHWSTPSGLESALGTAAGYADQATIFLH
jgi:hypothetical protein